MRSKTIVVLIIELAILIVQWGNSKEMFEIDKAFRILRWNLSGETYLTFL